MNKWLQRHIVTFLYVIVLSCITQPLTAYAYNRVYTQSGIPIYWKHFPIPYFIGSSGSQDLSDGTDIQAIHKAFKVWSSVACARVHFKFEGLVDAPQAASSPIGPHANHIFWVEDQKKWPFPLDAVAVSTVKWFETTGEIYDTDIRFNGVQYTWSTTSKPAPEKQDILNTAVHEIGHLLGLDHTDPSLTQATMHANTHSGETLKRDLTSDDEAGICAIYPKNPTDQLRLSVVHQDDGLRACPTNTTSSQKPKVHSSQGCQSTGSTHSFFFSSLLLLLGLVLYKAKRHNTLS